MEELEIVVIISRAEIRTILKIAVKDFPPYMDNEGKVNPPVPAVPIRPEDVVKMNEEERKELLRRIKAAIEEYFQRVGLPDEKAKIYFDEIVGYLTGRTQDAPEIKSVLPPAPSEAPTEKIQRPVGVGRRRRPPMERGPGSGMPVIIRKSKPYSSSNWYLNSLKRT